MKKRALIAGGAGAVATAALVLFIRATTKAGAPGFLGPGTLIADVNLVLEILLVLGLTFGFFLARKGNIEAHRCNQTAWVLINAVLVALIMASSMQDAEVKSLADFAETRLWITWLHALIGTATAVAGVWLVLQMNDILPQRLHVGRWKTLMRVTLAGYWTVALLGIATYYFWYIG